jgi:hypothetical protein
MWERAPDLEKITAHPPISISGNSDKTIAPPGNENDCRSFEASRSNLSAVLGSLILRTTASNCGISVYDLCVPVTKEFE